MFPTDRTPTIGAVLVFLYAGASIPTCSAQQLGPSISGAAVTVPPVPVAQPHAVSWSEWLPLLGGTGVLLAADPLVSLETSEHPIPEASDAASVFRVAGDSRFYVASLSAPSARDWSPRTTRSRGPEDNSPSRARWRPPASACSRR
jgi:hypothetical protein